jgi:hypothetical protein
MGHSIWEAKRALNTVFLIKIFYLIRLKYIVKKEIERKFKTNQTLGNTDLSPAYLSFNLQGGSNYIIMM